MHCRKDDGRRKLAFDGFAGTLFQAELRRIASRFIQGLEFSGCAKVLRESRFHLVEAFQVMFKNERNRRRCIGQTCGGESTLVVWELRSEVNLNFICLCKHAWLTNPTLTIHVWSSAIPHYCDVKVTSSIHCETIALTRPISPT